MAQRFKFSGTGGSLLVKYLAGLLLTAITFGIYLPWFLVKLTNFIYENLLLTTKDGDVKFEFEGTGGQLFGTYLVGLILTIITFGIYTPWFIVKMSRFFVENSTGRTGDGTVYRGAFSGTGGQLFGTYLVGLILTMITFGIYTPWFIVKMIQFYAQNTNIIENDAPVGVFAFNGTGGELLGTYLVGVILTSITFGIYGPWFDVNIRKFISKGTAVTLNDKIFGFNFVGTGGQNFVINFIGYLLTVVTFGIYGAWYMCNLYEFRFNNTVIKAEN